MPELRHLLVATDGSAPAEHAARFAGRVASRFDGAVRAVSVVAEPVTGPWFGTDAYMPSLRAGQDREVAHARRVSEDAASLAERSGCPKVDARVEIGDPAHAIVASADDYHAHAIVMGRRGTGNLAGLFMGSVSTKVSHLSDRTVITVRGEDRDVEQVLVAVDGSEHSMRAVELACVLAKGFAAELDIVHIVGMNRLIPIGMSGFDALEYDRLEDSLRHEGGQIVDEAKRMAADLDLVATSAIEVGDPAMRIIDRAAETDADVICIGRRGLGKIAGLLLGSVSHSVCHGADQTVITVW